MPSIEKILSDFSDLTKRKREKELGDYQKKLNDAYDAGERVIRLRTTGVGETWGILLGNFLVAHPDIEEIYVPSNLSTLGLFDTQAINSIGFDAFLSGLIATRDIGKLRVLNLSGTPGSRYTPEQMGMLTKQVLMNNPSLTSLDLSGCSLTDDHIRAMLPYLVNSKLEKIELHSNDITSAVIPALVDALLIACPNLRELGIYNNNISDANSSRVPNLAIESLKRLVDGNHRVKVTGIDPRMLGTEYIDRQSRIGSSREKYTGFGSEMPSPVLNKSEGSHIVTSAVDVSKTREPINMQPPVVESAIEVRPHLDFERTSIDSGRQPLSGSSVEDGSGVDAITSDKLADTDIESDVSDQLVTDPAETLHVAEDEIAGIIYPALTSLLDELYEVSDYDRLGFSSMPSKNLALISVCSASGDIARLNLLLSEEQPEVKDLIVPLTLSAQTNNISAMNALLLYCKTDEQRNFLMAQSLYFHENAPMYLAAKKGYVDIVDRLLGFELIQKNQTFHNNNEALLIAARHGHIAVVERMLQDSSVLKYAVDNKSALLSILEERFREKREGSDDTIQDALKGIMETLTLAAKNPPIVPVMLAEPVVALEAESRHESAIGNEIHDEYPVSFDTLSERISIDNGLESILPHVAAKSGVMDDLQEIGDAGESNDLTEKNNDSIVLVPSVDEQTVPLSDQPSVGDPDHEISSHLDGDLGVIDARSSSKTGSEVTSYFRAEISHCRNGSNNTQSSLTRDQLMGIDKLIRDLQKEIDSRIPYPNKDRKQEKIDALNELKIKAKEMSVADAVDFIDKKYTHARDGLISTRTTTLLDELKLSLGNEGRLEI